MQVFHCFLVSEEFIALYEMVLPFDPVDEILKSADHSNDNKTVEQ